jgi:hypothetical protein
MNRNKNWIRMVLTGVFAAGLLFATGKPAFADSCRDRLESARARLDRDVARRGENSNQVRRDQDRLEDARRWCRAHHSDWDHTRFDFGVYLRH